MMSRFLIYLALTFVCFDSVRADEDIFSESEKIYLTVFEDIIDNHNAPDDRVLAVAIGEKEFGTLIPMPDALWKQLSERLKAKGVDLSRIVPADEVVLKDEDAGPHLIHKPSGRNAWVYFVSGLNWHGGKRLHVPHSVYHGMLAGGGSTLILEKKSGKWIIVKRVGPWVS